MPSLNPVWFQRLPTDLRRHVEVAEAAAREGRVRVHAEQAVDLVAVLAPRMPFDEAIDHYIQIMDLGDEDSEVVRTRALVSLGEADLKRELSHERTRTGWAIDWRYATPLGAVRFVRRQLRRSAEEDLWSELAAARAEEALIREHVRHALVFVDILEEHLPPTQGVSVYLDRLEVPSARAHSVYQRTLAQVAERRLPRLTRRAAESG
jgi:hypothetical protein